MPSLDIRPDHLHIVRDILQKHVPNHEVWAFGSRAKWTARETSDLDLCVQGDEPLSFESMGLLRAAFEESDLPYKVDVVDWATTGEAFRKIIERDKVIVKTKRKQDDWQECSLGDVIELKRGYDLPQQKRKPGSVPIVSSSGISDYHAEAMAKAPGVITGRYGTIGKVFFLERDYWPLNTTLYVREFKGNDPKFISYLLETIDFHAYSDKGAVPGVNRNHLHMARVRVPSLPKQRAIAHILGTLDDKIELNRRINQTLEAMAQAIFKSWFIDFDPVRAKIAAQAEGRDPLRAAMRAISGKSDAELEALPREQYDQLTATVALFSDALEESELGDIPRGWRIQTTDEIADVGIGKTPPRKEPQWFTEREGDQRWVSIRDMGTAGVFQQKTSEFLTTEAISRFNIKVVPDHTVLLSFKLTIGRVSITDGPMATNEAIAHFKLLERSPIATEYLYLYLKAFDYTTLGSTSSIADAVNSKTIREMPVLIPEEKLGRNFIERVNPFFKEIKFRQSEIETLGVLRDALLSKLLSGEVEIPL